MPDPSAAPLTGRVVLVTGGSSGIGRAIAVAAAKAGANVALTYRQNEVGARATQHEIAAAGRRGLVMRMDLTDVHSIRAAGRAAHDAFGRIDVWINNAGADILTGPAEDYSTIDKLDLLLRVDLRGTMMASWEAVELFESQADGGVIINMSWDHVLTGMPGTNPQLFAAVKGGVLAFSKALARTVAPRVRVNIIAPGWIETSFASASTRRPTGRSPNRHR